MGRTKQLTIGMAAALVLLSSALLTMGLLWLKQHILRETPPIESVLNSPRSDTLVSATTGFEALQPASALQVETRLNASSGDKPEFVLGPILNDEK